MRQAQSAAISRKARSPEASELRLTAADAHCPVREGEFWTARQRQMHPLHYAVSYRASFKPELPDFFIRRCLDEAHRRRAVVLDPFGGRGTTALQANMLGCRAIHNDLNPVSLFIAGARSHVPELATLEQRLAALPIEQGASFSTEDLRRLGPFFHQQTLAELCFLRNALRSPEAQEDHALRYIGMTALSRLHGHSDGFFSVYSFPQISILPAAQERNNRRRGLRPEYRNLRQRILKKMRQDLQEELPEAYRRSARRNRILREDAARLKPLRTGSVDLIVTSPPFLDKVNYLQDNWMRAWFLGVEDEAEERPPTVTQRLSVWQSFMGRVMSEMQRLLRSGGRAIIEVGEVSFGGQTLNLEEALLAALPGPDRYGRLLAEEVLINRQRFTKLANCWDVTNNERGINSNRCLVLRKAQ